MPEERFLIYGGLLPLDADVIMLKFKNHDGLDILSSSDGATLWSASFPTDYRLQGDVIATQDHVIYVLHRDEGPDEFNVVLDTKIYVHNKYSGEIVRIIGDVPFHYGHKIHYHFPTGILYGGHGSKLFAIDPIQGTSFEQFDTDLGYPNHCRHIIGASGSELLLLMQARKDREVSMIVVHFDTERREVTYKQAFDGYFIRYQHVEVNKGFLFITDRDSTTHIYEWITQ